MKLKGKVALVTGGAKRVGRTLALGLAARGCHVAITYRTSAREALETVRAVRRQGVRSIAVQVDQRSSAQVRSAVKEISGRFGRLDLLINNASSFYRTPWDRVTDEQWDDLLSSNLTGPWWYAQASAKVMRRHGGGKILNIVDTAAFLPWPGYLPYCAAKGGLVTLTRGLARALAPRIQVNGIAPGPVLFPPEMGAQERRKAIEKTLLKKAGSPEDILHAALFLLEGSDYVTGVILPVDGGRLLA